MPDHRRGNNVAPVTPGAGLCGAVVVLCAAILTALMQSGLVTTISSGVQSATDSLFSPGDSLGTDTSETDADSDPGDANPGPGQDDADPPEASREDENSGQDDESGQGDNSGQDSDDGQDEGDSDSNGGGGHNAAPANNDGGGGWNLPDMPDMDDVQEQGGRFLDGAQQAGGNAVEDFQESADDLGQLIDDVRDDPVQAAQDRYEQGREDVENIRDAAEDDPLGLARDMIASDEAQEHCRNGRYAECVGMGVTENLSSGIPGFGWDKKRQRLEDLSDSAENNRGGDNDGGNSQDEESETRAEGAPSPPGDSSTDSRRDEENDDGEDSDSTEDSEQEGANCRSNSFLPATPVVLADGSRVDISEVEAGDAVWAFDPRTGAEGPRRVTDTISSAGDKQLVDVTVQDGDGVSQTLTAPQEHPFWAPKTGDWVEAGELQPGTWLRTSSGTWVQVQALNHRTASDQPVHNLTVEGLHTYYVGAGNQEVLVHNDCEGTVWENIEQTQDAYPGTELPRSFKLEAGSERVWVHANATKHIEEYTRMLENKGHNSKQINMATQAKLKSLHSAVKEATKNGVPLDDMQNVGGWELKFIPQGKGSRFQFSSTLGIQSK